MSTGGQERSDGGIRAVHAITLLTRADCSLCATARAVLDALSDELSFELSAIDVDAAAAAGDPTLRAEYGDLLPVVLLDGVQHSYWEVDADGLRADLGGSWPGAGVPDQARESRSDVPR